MLNNDDQSEGPARHPTQNIKTMRVLMALVWEDLSGLKEQVACDK